MLIICVMNKVLLSLFLLLFIQSTYTLQYEELWTQWKLQYKRIYSEEHESDRFLIFTQNFEKIKKFNEASNSVRLALNKYADISSKEFKDLYAGCAFTDSINKTQSNMNDQFLSVKDLPESVDWRDLGIVTPAKNQGKCGSCWSFAAVGALEGYYALRIDNLESFSEQQILDCSGLPNQGCQGGYPELALEYASKYGLEVESDYPYVEQKSTCKYQVYLSKKINIGYGFVPPYSKNALKASIAFTPTSVAVEADENVFQFYHSGVIGVGCGPLVDHAVLAVGYKIIDNTEAYVVKNSWGEDWGQNGYVYISTDSSLNSGRGACGILSYSVFPF